jgi:hypothetical protein
MRLLLPLAVVLAGCTLSGGAPLTPAELTVRMAAAERGSDLSRALVCGADQSLVNDFAVHDPPPPGSTRELARLYRAMVVTRVREDEALRGATLTPDTDECIAVRGRADLAPLWKTRRTGREEAVARSRGR